MRITQHADYALRVLIYVGGNPDRLVTIAEIAQSYAISRTHLMKVVNQLVREGFLIGRRGKGGGIQLGMPPAQIGVGAVMRRMESDFELVECMGPDSACRIDRGCRLKRVLGEALDAFLAVLDRHSLQDLLDSPATLRLVAALRPI